jgi:septal ring factor EnvC (AmiA/AmiB activator)
LIAEEVAKVNPDLVVRDANGEIYTVRYEAVNAMLLNEFLKENLTVQELKSNVAEQEGTNAQQRKDFQATITKLEAVVAQQQKELKALTSNLKDQAAQIQKVSAQLEMSKPTTRVVANHQ